MNEIHRRTKIKLSAEYESSENCRTLSLTHIIDSKNKKKIETIQE